MILLEWQKILQAQNDKLIPANAYWGIDICSCDCIKLRVHLNPLWHATIRSASFGNFSPTFDRNCLVEEETDDYGTDVLSRWKGKSKYFGEENDNFQHILIIRQGRHTTPPTSYKNTKHLRWFYYAQVTLLLLL